ncbi:MAG: hypothetical protein ABIT05_14730 [Chitinophagaceae bacterium]
MRFSFTTIFAFFFFNATAQTQAEWAQTVNWDGVSHWSKYIRVRAAYLGPNALAVPTISNGSIDSNSSAGITAQLHFSPGDKTQSIVLYGNYALVKGLISFDVSYIPVEYYTMSDAIKKERHVYYKYYNDKRARGDVLVNTTIQLFNKWRKSVQLALRMGFRYPSSSGFGAARFIDGLGYHFDISMAKAFHAIPLKWVAMAGFYCWQIEQEDFRQNDAFLFGTGFEWNSSSWRLQTYVAGYLGYLEHSGDKPVVFRTTAEKRIKKTSLLLRFQQGLHDFKYSTVEFGAKYYFK